MFTTAGIKIPYRYLYIGLSIITILVGCIASYVAYQRVDENQKNHIIDRANTIAQTISVEELSSLNGTEADLKKLSYTHLKKTLTGVRGVNSDIRFIYLIGKNEAGNLFFFLDSEDTESEDYSPPGQVYEEASPEMYKTIIDGVNRTDGPTRDRWGVWVSGYAPIINEQGKVMAILGMDTPANEHIYNNFAYASIPLLTALIILLLLYFLRKIQVREIAYLNMRERFLSIASHEIRTPLLGIRWALEYTMHKPGTQIDSESKSIIDLIYKNSVKLIQETNDLLSIKSLKDAGEKSFHNEKIVLSDLFKDIEESLSLSAKEHDVSVVVDESLTERKTTDGNLDHSILADYKNIRHVFLNLIGNAIKYSKPKTKVIVSHTKAQTDKSGRLGKKGWHVFTISDQGHGMNKYDVEHIFDGYYRAERATKSSEVGTGLGLYLSKKIIETMGGSITVESTLGEGSTFTVKIPV